MAAYFKPSAHADSKIGALVGRIADIETILTRTEKEALILESNLIKRHRPRYNVVLKDDKRYPSLRLDPAEDYPRFTVVRKIGEDDALYFGPFASAHAVRETLQGPQQDLQAAQVQGRASSAPARGPVCTAR
ncbi:MAG: hypothetical protein MZV70_67770 [Desulfobacterales bacterium]|nr:hypothetical protein [Desulfobacterales bacterium]